MSDRSQIRRLDKMYKMHLRLLCVNHEINELFSLCVLHKNILVNSSSVYCSNYLQINCSQIHRGNRAVCLWNGFFFSNVHDGGRHIVGIFVSLSGRPQLLTRGP